MMMANLNLVILFHQRMMFQIKVIKKVPSNRVHLFKGKKVKFQIHSIKNHRFKISHKIHFKIIKKVSYQIICKLNQIKLWVKEVLLMTRKMLKKYQLKMVNILKILLVFKIRNQNKYKLREKTQ